ncbi:hypothetical protein J23TS9_09950 [Paenibacillus sp. J23TS9]|uniref:hypothetical protein n=1 Tax=Paenibacillus sp. J23TS9 TaxID=2807193 RepID=UPI001B288E64|nr:hypothetical protein [Paenibacillus sp. J23TS9]GIP25865.1 hypothetical protein J23TS9_09950 [Paenibacillus sp. J23TS9]
MKLKKFATFLLSATFLLVPLSSSFAAEANEQSSSQKQVSIEESNSVKTFSAPSVAPKIDIPMDEIVDKKSNTIDKTKLKNELSKQSIGSNEIDAIIAKVDSINTTTLKKTNGEITPFVYTVLYNDWAPGKSPVLTYDGNWYTYAIVWLAEDNYRSTIPVTISTTTSSTINESLGFSGDINIKAKFGFQASYGASQTASKSTGVTVDAWTYWATRPYIYWNKKIYQGTWKYEYIDDAGYHLYETPNSGENRTLLTKTNDYWTRTNSAHSSTASSPIPPASMPY